jgi:hypothetical protein
MLVLIDIPMVIILLDLGCFYFGFASVHLRVNRSTAWFGAGGLPGLKIFDFESFGFRILLPLAE